MSSVLSFQHRKFGWCTQLPAPTPQPASSVSRKRLSSTSSIGRRCEAKKDAISQRSSTAKRPALEPSRFNRGANGALAIKVIFNLLIPRFDAKNARHTDLANAAKKAEGVAAKVSLPATVKFQRARALVREALADDGVSRTIDKLVARLLDA